MKTSIIFLYYLHLVLICSINSIWVKMLIALLWGLPKVIMGIIGGPKVLQGNVKYKKTWVNQRMRVRLNKVKTGSSLSRLGKYTMKQCWIFSKVYYKLSHWWMCLLSHNILNAPTRKSFKQSLLSAANKIMSFSKFLWVYFNAKLT